MSNGFDTLTVNQAIGARILVGVPVTASPTNTPASATFKTIKANTMYDTIVTGRETTKGDKTVVPTIKTKNAANSTFYRTTGNNTIQTWPIIGK